MGRGNLDSVQMRVSPNSLWEEWLEYVEGEGERLYGCRAGPHDHALDPQPDEGGEGTEGDVDVGVVGAGLLDHAAKLRVAVGAHLAGDKLCSTEHHS